MWVKESAFSQRHLRCDFFIKDTVDATGDKQFFVLKTEFIATFKL